MKYIIALLSLACLLALPALAPSTPAYAVDIFSHTCDKGENVSSKGAVVCQDVQKQQGQQKTNPIITILKAAINVISVILGAAAIIILLVGSIHFITAGGDANSVASARNSVLYALIGLAIAALAQTIVVFVLDKA